MKKIAFATLVSAGLVLTALFYHLAYIRLVRGLDDDKADDILSEISPSVFPRQSHSGDLS